jgi:hypothetical protein
MRPFNILRMRKAAGGGGGGSVVLNDNYIEGYGNENLAKTTSYRVASDGSTYAGISRNTNGQMDYTLIEAWLLSGLAANYQVRATVTAGSLTSGPTGWQACSVNNEWYIVADTGITKQTVILVELRDAAAPNTVRDSASITLYATWGEPV